MLLHGRLARLSHKNPIMLLELDHAIFPEPWRFGQSRCACLWRGLRRYGGGHRRRA
ncbi:hypothetical protein CHELA40_13882 [Chelatococcus asaccharovorans]|nr:hypothetical protein CHELA40_13882 [Chelatococcus asaccharovorans]CAH1674982.1 hypothetical protein CHELA17_61746 [Chelatococcus asaccharovorans]